MVDEHNMALAITKAATEASKQLMKIIEAETPVSSVRTIKATLWMRSPALKQPTFEWKAQGKYNELYDFEIEVKKHFFWQTV